MSKAHKVEIIKHTEINEIVFYISEFTYKLSHIHKDMELDLVLDVHFFVRANDEFYEAGAGSILVFNPYKPHEFMLSLIHISYQHFLRCPVYSPGCLGVHSPSTHRPATARFPR